MVFGSVLLPLLEKGIRWSNCVSSMAATPTPENSKRVGTISQSVWPRQAEKDTPEAFRERKQLVELLVESISVGKQDGGRAEIQITYRFGPPPTPGLSEAPEDTSMSHLKNGREFSTPPANPLTLTLVAMRR